jgi:hypothetical protein
MNIQKSVKRIATMRIPDYSSKGYLTLNFPIRDLKCKKLAIFDLDDTFIYYVIKSLIKEKYR